MQRGGSFAVRWGYAIIVMALVTSTVSMVFAQTGEVKERSQIDSKYKWDLAAIYKSDADWEKDVAALEGMIPALKAYQGKISQSPENLLAFFKVYQDAGLLSDKTLVYANLGYDQDTRDQKYNGYSERISSLGAQVGEALSWFSPELVAIPDSIFNAWYKAKPELKLYKQYIDNQLRTRTHTLSPAEERILALSGPVARTPSSTSNALRDTDLKFPTIKDENGNDVEISEGRMLGLYESPSAEVRRNAAMALLTTYGNFKNTAASLMTGNISKDIFYTRARGYNSCLHAALDGENIDTTVFINLVTAVKKHTGVLQKYTDLRRRALGLDSIHLYDMFAPLIPETRVKVGYDEAVATITTAVAPLGKDYVDAMKSGFSGGWVDVYENQGKHSGAYSWGAYGSHPYMLMNYNDTMDDMFTTAHEMGHAMHTYLSHKNQPYIYSSYEIFVAEVASTMNEALLMDNLLKKEKDPAKRLALVNQYIDQIRGTLITQVMFADFELRMHRRLEEGQPLTAETLSNMYRETLSDYYGTSAAIDPEYGYTWIRIPHFYRNYYVYKYATSYAASQALSQKVLKGEKGAREKYIHFLSSGNSEYPIDLLKDAGVDMTTSQPVEAAMKKFGELVDEMERLLKQLKRI